MKYKNDIKDILFHYADSLTLKTTEGEGTVKGFLYKKRRGHSGYLAENGVIDKDSEYALVASCPSIKKGDMVLYNGSKFYISEVEPLCVKDKDAGVAAKAVMIKD